MGFAAEEAWGGCVDFWGDEGDFEADGAEGLEVFLGIEFFIFVVNV